MLDFYLEILYNIFIKIQTIFGFSANIREAVMMKKRGTAGLAGLLVLCMLFLSSCGGTGKNDFSRLYGEEGNLALGSSYTDINGAPLEAFTLNWNDSYRNHITVDLGDSKRFNTITLTEAGDHVKQFAIYGSNEADKGYVFLYQGDAIGSCRVCYTGERQYRYLRLIISDFSGEYSVTGMSVYLNKNENAADLRVNAYVRMDFVNEETDFSGLAGCTDLILFGMAKLNADGHISFVDGNGEEISEAEYAEKVELVREAIGERDIRIFADLALPYGNDGKDIVSMMRDQLSVTAENLRSFIYKYNFDGYDVDYEYPYSDEEWEMYNTYIRTVADAMPDKMISVAAGAWNLHFEEDVIERIDRVELMTYDIFDTFGYHADFAYTADAVFQTIAAGFSPEQIDIGLPFYSRPIDGYAFWGDYKTYAERLGRYNNLMTDNTFDHDGAPLATPQYFNGVQMISDKTAFALDAGVGGVMIWHFTCDMPYDSELSLFRAIQTVKNEKSIANG